jgi:hypothetical protein
LVRNAKRGAGTLVPGAEACGGLEPAADEAVPAQEHRFEATPCPGARRLQIREPPVGHDAAIALVAEEGGVVQLGEPGVGRRIRRFF